MFKGYRREKLGFGRVQPALAVRKDGGFCLVSGFSFLEMFPVRKAGLALIM